MDNLKDSQKHSSSDDYHFHESVICCNPIGTIIASDSMPSDLELTVETDIPEQQQMQNDLEQKAKSKAIETLSEDKEKPRNLNMLVNPAQKAANVAVTTVGAFIPKMEKLPWPIFFTLSFLIAIPALIFIAGFTKMGYGHDTHTYIDDHLEAEAWYLFVGITGFAFFLYLFDCYYWDSPVGRIWKTICVTTLLLSASAYVLFLSGNYPYGPISLYIILNPIYLVTVKNIFFKEKETRTYVSWLSGPLFFISMVTLTTWIYWTFDGPENEWTSTAQIKDAKAAGCTPQEEGNGQCFDKDGNMCFVIKKEIEFLTNDCDESCPHLVYYDCSNPFIIWAGPFLVSVGLLFLSFFCTFLRGTATVDQEIMRFVKVWVFMIFTMWVSASLAGAGEGVSTTLAALTLSAFIASAVFLAFSYTEKEQEQRLGLLWAKFLGKYGDMLDIAKGLIVVTCAPVAVVYFISSFLNQVIRKYNPWSKAPSTSDSTQHIDTDGFVTVEARRLLRAISKWNAVPVCTYAVYWGIGFLSFAVLAPIFTTLFLSWIIEFSGDFNLQEVTGILVIVGTIMFLLPPVPGAPVYLTLGIVIIPVGKETFGDDAIGLVTSMAYSMGVSLALKLLATALQQKMIGGLLKGYVGVRRLVGINTDLIRAMKLLLIQPGLSMAKVSILCGGPDWPTSVLCGILDLPLTPILVGTLPVMNLVIPTCLAGSFTYLSSSEGEYGWAETAAALSTAVAAGVLFTNMILAAYYVEDTLTNRAEEVKALPIDEEVKALEDHETIMEHKYNEVTRWEVVPGVAKCILILSVLCIIVACYIVQIFRDQAFKSYVLTDTIDEKLDGDWKNIAEPLGLFSMALSVVSILFFQLFTSWASRKVSSELENEGIPASKARDLFKEQP
jgi:hypothetical protein